MMGKVLLFGSIILLLLNASASIDPDLIEIFPNCSLIYSEYEDLYESNFNCCYAYQNWCMEIAKHNGAWN